MCSLGELREVMKRDPLHRTSRARSRTGRWRHLDQSSFFATTILSENNDLPWTFAVSSLDRIVHNRIYERNQKLLELHLVGSRRDIDPNLVMLRQTEKLAVFGLHLRRDSCQLFA